MESKVIAFLGFLCLMQATDSKAVNPFWGGSPFLANFAPFALSPVDIAIQPIIADVQTRLNQASTISKSSIGMNVGLASKSIGMQTSLAKTNIKTTVNNLQSNPTISKECMQLHKDTIDQLNTESKNQLSFCSKSSQLQLKSMNQVQKDLSFQVTTLSNELTLAVNQCKLQNSVVADTTAVVDCVTLKADEIREKLTVLEQSIMDTIAAVNAAVSQTSDGAKSCMDQIEQQVQEQTQSISAQLDMCNAAMSMAPVATV